MGVRIAELPELATTAAPTWRTKRAYTTDDAGVLLHEAQAGAFLPDGSLLIANSGSSEILLFDPDGVLVRTIGRSGEGPGEYGYINWLDAREDGSVLVYDVGLARLTTLNADYEVEATRPLHTGVGFKFLLPLAFDSGGTVLATYGRSNVFNLGEWRDTVPLLSIGPGATSPDTLGLWPGQEKAAADVQAGKLRLPVGFGRTAIAAGGGGRVVIASTDSLLITVRAIDGTPTLIVRGAGDPTPVSERDRSAWLEEVTGLAPMDSEDFLREWTRGPVRETYPAFGALALDDEARLWVGEATRPGASTRSWVIFGADGVPEGRIELPTSAPHPLFARPEVLDIREGRIALLLRDEWNEQVVVVLSYASVD